jgi:pyroglutamyl-peptidase
MFGLAARRRHICIETRARNARSLVFPDVGGSRAERAAIETGPARELKGSAPFALLLAAVRRTALPARLSRDAGTYLCNYAYWRALQRVRDNYPLVQFVHIPSIAVAPRRGAFKRRASPLSRLVTAGENLLIALLAARRRSFAAD